MLKHCFDQIIVYVKDDFIVSSCCYYNRSRFFHLKQYLKHLSGSDYIALKY